MLPFGSIVLNLLRYIFQNLKASPNVFLIHVKFGEIKPRFNKFREVDVVSSSVLLKS